MLDGNERSACEAEGRGSNPQTSTKNTSVAQGQSGGLQNRASGVRILSLVPVLDVRDFQDVVFHVKHIGNGLPPIDSRSGIW